MLLPPATEEQTESGEMGCLNMILITDSNNTALSIIKLVTNTRLGTILYFN